MAFFWPRLFGSAQSLSAGEALLSVGWIPAVRCGACRGVPGLPEFLTDAGGSSYRAGVAEQRCEAVSPTAESSVTQTSVPEHLPAPTCRAQRGMDSLGCKEATVPFSPEGSLLSGCGKVSALLVWV